MSERETRLIAFYLPQYHPIPENDAWWGKGFTEWTNVARARPLFAGHEQPDLPADLGFYDLRLPEVRQAQADLARAYGIDGFCYYHYWFNGRMLLERPFDEVLASGTPDFPFCLCWANENWTRAWDGLDREVLVEQKYNADDDREHLRWLANAFRDARYIRVGNRPLLLVYRVSLLPNPRKTAQIWRDEARKLGFDDLYLCTVESLSDKRLDPATIGFDAAVEFQPDWQHLPAPLQYTAEQNSIYDYAAVAQAMMQKPAAPYTRFPCVVPGWDNTARRRSKAFVFHNSAPAIYQQWLESTLSSFTPPHPEANFVFINAWNEWAEGAHLEPNQRWGHGYLEATRNALQASLARPTLTPAASQPGAAPTKPPLKLSVCIPAYNGAQYLGAAIRSVLDQTFTDFELIVVDDCSSDGTEAVVGSFSDSRITYIKNSYRHGLVGNWNKCIETARGEYICIFHQDDLMLPDNLAEKVAVLDRYPAVGFVYSNVFQVGPNEELISEWWYYKPHPSENGVHSGAKFFQQLLLGENIVCCPSVMVRSACYGKLGGFDARLPFTADWEMWLRLALWYDVYYLIKPLVKYRRHEANETLNFSGIKEIEQAFQARALALEKAADRLPGAAQLRADVINNHMRMAVDRAIERYEQGDRAQARASFAFALQLRAACPGEPHQADEWFLAIVDRMLHDRPHQPAAAASAAEPAGEEAPILRQPLRYQPVFRQAIDEMTGRDIAENFSIQKIIKAVIHKIAARPAFRWMYRFRSVSHKILGP